MMASDNGKATRKTVCEAAMCAHPKNFFSLVLRPLFTWYPSNCPDFKKLKCLPQNRFIVLKYP